MFLVKSFTSRKDAEDFVAGKKVASKTDEPEKFYAVAVGNPPGIYMDWEDASAALKGVKGPKYKRFGKRTEAVAFIKQFGSREAIEALGEDADSDSDLKAESESEPELEFEVEAKPTSKNTKGAAFETFPANTLPIYTDGSSLANGKAGSRAGLGVYFGDGDPRNLSERLPGKLQTNQRAELLAIQRALEIAPSDVPVRIFTDSQYSINCVTTWAPGWAGKGWKTATGTEVKNQDIIRCILQKMNDRTAKGAETYFQWVKGHATNRGNIAADRLAVNGANMPSFH